MATGRRGRNGITLPGTPVELRGRVSRFAARCHAVTASLSRPAPSSSASFEPLQCEGPASTGDSGCHAGRHLTGSREVDFQAKSYVFSRPFHLIVSYGHLLPRRLCSGPAGAPPGAVHRGGAEGGQRALPLQRRLPEPRPRAPGNRVPLGAHSPGTVSGPGAPSRTLSPAPGGRPADPELPDQAAPAEVGRAPPLLLLQGRPGRAQQGRVPGASGACGRRGPLWVLLVRGCHRGRPSVETQPQAGGWGAGSLELWGTAHRESSSSEILGSGSGDACCQAPGAAASTAQPSLQGRRPALSSAGT
ncbi:Fc receptor-like A isoform 5-T5 [Glossophaga mutica]